MQAITPQRILIYLGFEREWTFMYEHLSRVVIRHLACTPFYRGFEIIYWFWMGGHYGGLGWPAGCGDWGCVWPSAPAVRQLYHALPPLARNTCNQPPISQTWGGQAGRILFCGRPPALTSRREKNLLPRGEERNPLEENSGRDQISRRTWSFPGVELD